MPGFSADKDLPSDVLEKIFSHLCPSFTSLPIARHSSTFVLSRVCSHWRKIAIELLFRRFLIRFYSDGFGRRLYDRASFELNSSELQGKSTEEKEECRELKFKSWEEKVMSWLGQYPPTTLWIDFVWIIRSVYDTVGQNQFDLFAEMASRLVKDYTFPKLILSLPNGDPYDIIEGISDQNREAVEEVTIYPAALYRGAPGRPIVPLNNLKFLRTNGPYLPRSKIEELPFPLSFRSLTTLEMVEIPAPIDDCLETLKEYGASLERFAALVEYEKGLDPDSMRLAIKLPLLRVLSLHFLPTAECSIKDTAEGFLDCLELPALEILRIWNPSDPESKVPSAVLRLWNRSGKPEISRLCLAVKAANVQGLEEICTPQGWRGLWPVHFITDYDGP